MERCGVYKVTLGYNANLIFNLLIYLPLIFLLVHFLQNSVLASDTLFYINNNQSLRKESKIIQNTTNTSHNKRCWCILT